MVITDFSWWDHSRFLLGRARHSTKAASFEEQAEEEVSQEQERSVSFPMSCKGHGLLMYN